MKLDWSGPTTRVPAARYGLALFRIFLGAVLVYGTWDNVASGERMLEFREFLAANGFAYPLFCAHLSAWAQFVCGLAIALGLATRLAAAVMVVNFVVALAMVHVGLPFSANIAPLAMLFGAALLVLDGGGPFSLDARLQRVRRPEAVPLGVPLGQTASS